MKALHINLNTCLMRPLAAAFVAVLVLSGCATRDKDGIGKDDAFMQHWQNQSVDRQGFSPALEDLAPEPRRSDEATVCKSARHAARAA